MLQLSRRNWFMAGCMLAALCFPALARAQTTLDSGSAALELQIQLGDRPFSVVKLPLSRAYESPTRDAIEGEKDLFQGQTPQELPSGDCYGVQVTDRQQTPTPNVVIRYTLRLVRTPCYTYIVPTTPVTTGTARPQTITTISGHIRFGPWELR